MSSFTQTLEAAPFFAVPYAPFFLVAGEPSGDLIGSLLIKQLKYLSPQHPCIGIGGEKMVRGGMKPIGDLYGGLQLMGFTDVILSLPRIATSMLQLEREILRSSPIAVILIDFQTFNLKLAKRLRKKGYKGKIIQYVSPAVWAWKSHRIPSMTKCLDLVLTLFPFEPACYAGTSLKAVFVGHPLLEVLPPPQEKKKNLLTLFPGSRISAVKNTFPLQIEAAKKILEKFPHFKLAISCANEAFLPYLQSQTKGMKVSFFSKDEQYVWMDNSKIALATSGTVTMELAWFYTPTLVFYGMSLFNRLMSKYIFKLDQIPFYCMVNILANKEIFPEKIKSGFEAESVLLTVENLLHERGGEVKEACQSFWNQLYPDGFLTPSMKAAQEILGILS